MRLVLCVLVEGTERIYDKELKKAIYEHRKYYDSEHQEYGRGMTTDSDKLTLLAISSQVWGDFSGRINSPTDMGEFAYQNPVDLTKPAVWYMWKIGKPAPYTGAIGSSANFGSTGCVDRMYKTRTNAAGVPVRFPESLVSAKGTPTDYYYSKAGLHLYDCVRILEEREQALLVAEAYPNGKYLFQIGWKNTDFEHYLEEEDFLKIFANVEQLWVDDSRACESVVLPGAKNDEYETDESKAYETESQEGPIDVESETPAAKKAPAKAAAPSAPKKPASKNGTAKKPAKEDKYDKPLPNEEDDEAAFDAMIPLGDDNLESLSSDDEAENEETQGEEYEQVNVYEDEEGWIHYSDSKEYCLDDDGNRQKLGKDGNPYTPPPVQKITKITKKKAA
jgi:hypothetical protein